MDENWDDEPASNGAGNFNGESVDSGRNFSRGRGFTKSDSDGPGGDNGWGNDDSSSNFKGFSGHGGRSGRGGNRNSNFDNNANGEDGDGSWGDSNNDRRGRGGRGGRGRGGRGSGGFRNNSNDGDEWGGDGDDSHGGDRGNFRGGRGRGGRGGGGRRFDTGDNDSGDNDGGWGGRGRRGRAGRGGRNDNADNDAWGSNNDGDNDGGWGGGDDSGGGRGRGRGRGGGRGASHADGQDDENAPEKPREIYVPPEPTEDVDEMFGTAITSGINFDKYDVITTEVTGDNAAAKIKSFEESGLRESLLNNIKKSGYLKPTPVQKAAIPIIMARRDVMACAQTGSGKTAAFLLPIINRLLEEKPDKICGTHCEPQVVIVSPTRELAIQIGAEARKFAYDTLVKTVVTYGGTSVGYSIRQILDGCHILVATPGRMNDFVQRDRIKFSSVQFVVLDEADRMLDMGFLPDIEKMMNHETMVPTGKRQTLMFSATFPEEIQRLAANFLNDYLFITVGIVGGACSDVQQVFHEVDKFSKRQKLITLLGEEGCERTLVFVETKRNADFLATYLSENNFRTTSIHGDRLQREREEALRDFKSGHRDILVATDVAARGLDIKNVKHVINYDLPKSIDEYVHRIGRTGRVGNSGKATSFFDNASQDSQLASNLLRILRQANQKIPDFLEQAAAGGGGSYNSGKFGGRDYRGEKEYGQAKDFSQNNVTEEPEEEW